MKNSKFIFSIIVFIIGLIFLSSIFVIYHQKSKTASDKSYLNKEFIMKMRLEAIETAKKEGKNKYQFRISSKLPLFPSFGDMGEK